MHPPEPVRPGALRQLWTLVAKELSLEGAVKTRFTGLAPFAVLVCLLFSFAVGPQPQLLGRLAPGFLWLAVLFASVQSLSESMALERQHASFEGLRLLGVAPGAMYLAKALTNWFFLLALSGLLLPVSVALFDAKVTLGAWPLLRTLLLGTAAISAPGTLFAALASDLRARDLLLPLLMFPLLVPGLLSAVRATSLVMLGDPMDELFGWSCLLLGFNVIYWLLCSVLFERVVEG